MPGGDHESHGGGAPLLCFEGVVQVGICAGGIRFTKRYPHQQDGDVEDHPGYLTRRHTEQRLRPLDQ